MGSGQLRQFGRLALWRDLINGKSSVVLRGVLSALDTIAQHHRGQRLRVIFVASLAGGTGSSILIDMALLARTILKTTPHTLTGFFALPRAFDTDADSDMLARAFATWRELNRFMTATRDFPCLSPEYGFEPIGQQWPMQIDYKVLDVCYLGDGVRGGERLGADR